MSVGGVAGLGLGAALVLQGPAQAACTVDTLLELPVTLSGGRPLVSAKIDGAAVTLMADSGATFSSLDRATADMLKLRRDRAPWNLRIQGVGGETNPEIAHVKALALANVVLKDRTFLLLPTGGAPAPGVLGQDVLGARDVEYDFGHGMIRLMKPDGCGGGASLAYWAGDKPVSVIEIDRPTGAFIIGTVGVAQLNGVRLRVKFDTGAQVSVLDERAAARAGVKSDSPGVRPGGVMYGEGSRPLSVWIGRFASVQVGDEQIQNPQIRFGRLDLDDADLLLGADFFLSHRIYVSNAQHKLYLTYDGGPVFRAQPQAMVRDAPGQPPRPAPQVAAADEEPTRCRRFRAPCGRLCRQARL
jgi:predicted aspartyl protease